MLALLDAIPDGSLSPDWASVVAFRQAIGHLTLGDEQGMLDAAQRCARLAGDSADRHVVALVEWFAGNPLPALRTAEAMDVDASRSQINAVILGSIRTMVLASAGLVDEAARRLADTERAVSGSASALMLGALVGIRALLAAAQGDDDHARRVLEESLQAAPLTDPVGWRMSARWLPLAYVLVPSTREHLDHRPTGVVHTRRLDVARAVVASLEGFATLPPAARALAPASVATTVPLPWAMALAARLTADGDVGGRALVEYLFALYGEPAREAVRAAATHSDPSIVDGARRLLASITIAPRHSIRLGVLGPVTLQIGDGAPVNDHWNRDRVRSLLVYLVIHGPAQRDQILEALWPHLDPGAADRNLRVTLSYLHQVLEPDRRKGEAPFYVRQIGPTLSLADDPHLVVDLHEFESALERADDADHRGLPSVALELLERALRLWRGRCLTDVADEDWAQPTCRRLTDRYVTAAVRAGELHFAAGRGTSAVHDARRALMADPWCEPAYCLLVAIGLARGDTSAAAQALAECDATLADLGVTGGPQIEMLRRRLHGGAPSMAIGERSVRRRGRVCTNGQAPLTPR